MRYKSSLGRKQRKALYNLPWHQRRKKMGTHLDGKLIEKYHTRSIAVRKGDTVRVLRGDADIVGLEAKVVVIDIKGMKIVVEGVTLPKADGKQKQRWIDPSNVIITKLDLSDPLRRRRIEKRGRLVEGELKEEAAAPEPKDAKEEKGKEEDASEEKTEYLTETKEDGGTGAEDDDADEDEDNEDKDDDKSRDKDSNVTVDDIRDDEESDSK
jgi:large subunit ribosomal protein L24